MSGIDLQRFWRRPSSPAVPAKAGPQASPTPAVPQALPAPTDPIAAEVETLVEQLRQAMRAAGVGREDPMMPLLHSLAHFIRFIGKRTADSDRTGTETSLRIVEALTLAKSTADAERQVFEAGLATAQARTISEISSAIASSAEAALTRRVRVYDRNTIFIVVAFVFVSMGCCSWVGYAWGRTNALAGVQQTELELRAAFTFGPANANLWMTLMQWNPVVQPLKECSKPDRALIGTDGRKACSVPLWIEPPKPVVAP